jgi:hypothetical protein
LLFTLGGLKVFCFLDYTKCLGTLQSVVVVSVIS